MYSFELSDKIKTSKLINIYTKDLFIYLIGLIIYKSAGSFSTRFLQR